MEEPASTVAPAPASLALVVHGVEAAALAALLVLRQFGVIANEPWWVYALVVVGSSAANRKLERWIGAPRGSWQLHVRVLMHALTVLVVIYLTGWGPALGVCFVYTALIDLQQTGSSSWRAVLGWSLVCSAVGQTLVWTGVAPSFLDPGAAQTMGFLGAFAFTIVIVMAGSIGEGKERAEHMLAVASEETARREALHRAVIENAAEGIFTIDSDGFVLSFNAAAEKIFGWSAAEMLGRPGSLTLAEGLHGLLDDYLLTARTVGYEAATHGTFEVTGVRHDGTQFPMVISTSAILVEGSAPMTCCLVRDLSEQKRLETELSHQALHDALTGLPNRTMLIDRLEQALARSRRTHRVCGVLYVDLDRFKSVNDTLGHATGDQVLVEAARRIQAVVRETNTVARLGGDEFVIVCDDLAGYHEAMYVTRRIASALQEPYFAGEDNEVRIAASIGIALSSEGTEVADNLIANADVAMYRAKQNGRNRYELFDAAMQEWITKRAAAESDLRYAVVRDELYLEYQPIVTSETGQIRGFEALLRWNRPGHGLISPDEFIPTAEDTGLIIEIGAWVLHEACRQAADWARRYPDRRLGVAVNVSSRQLASEDIVAVVATALTQTGLEPNRLTLELTESTVIDDTVNTQVVLHALRNLGVNLSLDDFGTGYSSLTYLRSLPINVVKIDKSFIRTLGTEREDTAIVSSVLSLARNLDVVAVAEGVETAAQLAVLLQLQCPYVQGYLFSPPVLGQDLADLIAAPAFRA